MTFRMLRHNQTDLPDLIMLWDDDTPLKETACPRRGVVIEGMGIPAYIPLTNYQTLWDPDTQSMGIRPLWHNREHSVTELLEFNRLLDLSELPETAGHAPGVDYPILESRRFRYLEEKRYPRLPREVVARVQHLMATELELQEQERYSQHKSRFYMRLFQFPIIRKIIRRFRDLH